MTQDLLLEKLQRYEAALLQIARRVADQAALEQHQRRTGLPIESIILGREYAYTKIAPIAADVLKCYAQDPVLLPGGIGPHTVQ